MSSLANRLAFIKSASLVSPLGLRNGRRRGSMHRHRPVVLNGLSIPRYSRLLTQAVVLGSKLPPERSEELLDIIHNCDSVSFITNALNLTVRSGSPCPRACCVKRASAHRRRAQPQGHAMSHTSRAQRIREAQGPTETQHCCCVMGSQTHIVECGRNILLDGDFFFGISLAT